MDDLREPKTKRRKLSDDSPYHDVHESPWTAQDLRSLLAFEQDLAIAKTRVKRFKSFVQDLKWDKLVNGSANDFAILLEFLQLDDANSLKEHEHPLSGLLQSWQFAVKLENDSLCCLIPAVLALLFKRISHLVQFQAAGCRLCQYLLKTEHLSLFERSLGASVSKEFLIDPCLRLLTQLIQFDGGFVASTISRHRAALFFRLDEFIGSRRKLHEKTKPQKHWSSLRETAVKYLLANLSLQDQKAKEYLLGRSRNLTRGLLEDSPQLLDAILKGMKFNVLEDTRLSLSAKKHFFNTSTLVNLAGLYQYDEREYQNSPCLNIKAKIHDLLVSISVSSRYRLTSTSVIHSDGADKAMSGGMSNTFATNRDAQTTNLSSSRSSFMDFLKKLRPYADSLQADLMVRIFESTPDLAYEYFLEKENFQLDPKLTMTWIGYMRFLTATVQVPIQRDAVFRLSEGPAFLDRLLGCILPQPCKQDVLTKCLNQPSPLITFMTVNLLNASFVKLQKVSHMLSQSEKGKEGNLCIEELQVSFAERCPRTRHLVHQFQSCPKDNLALRESILRLLLHYYLLVPNIALEAKLDITGSLTEALTVLPGRSISVDLLLSTLQSDMLIKLSLVSSSARWFSRPAGLRLSLFGLLVKSCVSLKSESPSVRVETCVDVASENHILQSYTAKQSFGVLLISLKSSQVSKHDAVYEFIDLCATKVAKTQIVYRDRLRNLCKEEGLPGLLHGADLLIISMLEQWERQVRRQIPGYEIVWQWLELYLRYVADVSRNSPVIAMVQKRFRQATALQSPKTVDSKTADSLTDQKNLIQLEQLLRTNDSDDKEIDNVGVLEANQQTPDDAIKQPPPGSRSHPELHRWVRMDLQDCFVDGTVSDVVLCLCSQFEEIRKEAATSLRKILVMLDDAKQTFRSWRQEKLVLLEVLETYNLAIKQPLPHIVGQHAAEYVRVQHDPMHLMYPKVNKYLLLAPQWKLVKMIRHWFRDVILSAPSETEKYYDEVDWLLTLLHRGLATLGDVDFYRICNVFESILCACLNLPDAQVQQVVDILLRSVALGGSTTLITRCGLLNWIDGFQACRPKFKGQLAHLSGRLWDTCDQAYVAGWKGTKLDSGDDDKCVGSDESPAPGESPGDEEI